MEIVGGHVELGRHLVAHTQFVNRALVGGQECGAPKATVDRALPHGAEHGKVHRAGQLIDLVLAVAQVDVPGAGAVGAAQRPGFDFLARSKFIVLVAHASGQAICGIAQVAAHGLAACRAVGVKGILQSAPHRPHLGHVLDHLVLARAQRKADFRLVNLHVGRIRVRRIGAGHQIKQDVVLAAKSDTPEAPL